MLPFPGGKRSKMPNSPHFPYHRTIIIFFSENSIGSGYFFEKLSAFFPAFLYKVYIYAPFFLCNSRKKTGLLDNHGKIKYTEKKQRK